MAITAGLAHASGDAAVIIDADLQDPPELIGELVARWREGYEVVYAVRTDREGETAFKRSTAKAFYRMLNRLSDTEIALDAGDFRLLGRRAVDALLSMPERDRFVRGMVGWVGFQQAGVPYRREARAAGATKYPLGKMLRFALDGVVSFSFAPLRLAVWLGFAASALALAGVVYSIVVWLAGDTVPGWTTLSIAVLFLGGLQLLSLGIVGEYVGRIYREVKRRPLYVVDETVGFAADRARQPDEDVQV
jgi:dolichol-phosphate mannosyltransferase